MSWWFPLDDTSTGKTVQLSETSLVNWEDQFMTLKLDMNLLIIDLTSSPQSLCFKNVAGLSSDHGLWLLARLLRYTVWLLTCTTITDSTSIITLVSAAPFLSVRLFLCMNTFYIDTALIILNIFFFQRVLEIRLFLLKCSVTHDICCTSVHSEIVTEIYDFFPFKMFFGVVFPHPRVEGRGCSTLWFGNKAMQIKCDTFFICIPQK